MSINEKLFHIIIAPRISEKSNRVAEKLNQVVFDVRPGATKKEIHDAVELLFKVKVQAVRTCRVQGKTKRFGSRQGQQDSYKKAYISLQPGQEMNFSFGE
ncbi:MAG: 50S ribosomal protein L23 [Pseudomonadota bacterium]